MVPYHWVPLNRLIHTFWWGRQFALKVDNQAQEGRSGWGELEQLISVLGIPIRLNKISLVC